MFKSTGMSLSDRRNTSFDLASTFRGRRNTLHRWGEKSQNTIGARLSAPIFQRRLAELLRF